MPWTRLQGHGSPLGEQQVEAAMPTSPSPLVTTT